MKNLSQYKLEEEIFVDANIFIFHFAQHEAFGESCTHFLEMIETGNIRAITSTVVLNEVMYVLLMKRGADLLGDASRWKIREQMEKNPGFAQDCYDKVDSFLEYIGELKSSELSIVNVDYDIFCKSVELGKKYGLITRDAIHSATCKAFNISHIATSDEHFDKVEFLSVWKPI